MISVASIQDKEELLSLWEYGYPKASKELLALSFEVMMNHGKCIINKQDSQIVSSIQIRPYVISIQGRKLMAAHLSKVVTLPDYRHRGYMKELMKNALDETSHRYLLTTIDAFHPALFEKYGFENTIFRKYYTLTKDQLKGVFPTNISRNATAKELKKIYDQFSSYFYGCEVREEYYFQYLLDSIDYKTRFLCVYRNHHKEVEGYAFYTLEKNDFVVKEIIYLQSETMLYIFAYIMSNHESIHILVSQNEKLERIFPFLIPKKIPALMMNVSSYDLYNKLMNTKITAAHEIFETSKKPTFNIMYD